MNEKEKNKNGALNIVKNKLHKEKRGRPKPMGQEEGFDENKLISIDQPFDYEEVVSITGHEYVQNLHHDGVAVPFYEEVKKNTAGFRLLEEECVWMKAGIINFRLCDNEYDCYHCAFDHSMRHAMESKYPSKGKTSPALNWVYIIRLSGTYLKMNFLIFGRPLK